jgi:hypothetical protein
VVAAGVDVEVVAAFVSDFADDFDEDDDSDFAAARESLR